MVDTSQAPIFIVGAPRSGTTLLATILASHSQISCGPETHFFPYLEANYQHIAAVLGDVDWPTKATEFVGAIAVENHPIAELFGVTTQEIYRYLAARKPSLQALLESLTEQHRIALGKRRWAEKTPNHILHLATLRRLFPTAKVVRIVRDPRDVALSMAAKLPWTSHAPLDSAYLIERWYRQSKPFFERDRLAYTLQYETLVTQPTDTLQQLCRFLQAPFEPAMLNTEAAAQYTAPAHETWKDQVAQALDSSRCLAWQMRSPQRAGLGPSPDTNLKAISTVCHEIIKDFNYRPLECALTPIFSCYTSERFVRDRHQEIDHLLAHNHLLVPCDPLTLSVGERVVYCDVPISGYNYGKSLRKFGHFCLTLAALRLKGVTVEFCNFGLSPKAEKNRFGQLAAHLLQRLGSPTELLAMIGQSSSRQ
ncbi:sulfotransferase [Nodosilinea sp. LEGE 07298]|uniref:sulfotransferase family protein n=1 Tax=Nodosilinea sp. LEGE 07298 TaxID=2777970 RepID=UPI00187EA8B6|nr:sulfotransferase [Nodosilinea sp. LEGE 07298]MBE9112705.1 sulfotransferase [Nodosilinea sp. LEGE 07298]